MTKIPILTYSLLALAVITVGLWTIQLIPETIMLSLLGIFGFSGIAGLRSFIEARGWKTYFSAAAAIAGAVVQFFLPEIVTPERLALWLGTWGVITQATLTHARQKEIRAGYIGRIGER